MSILVSDAFTRANSSTSLGSADTGQAWTVNTAGEVFGITSNQARWISGTASVWSTASIDSTVADCSVSVDTDGNTDSALVFRLVDDNNYWLWISSGPLYKKVAGSFTLVSSPVGAGIAATYTASLSGSTIQLYVNGALVQTTTDSFNSIATKHGFACFTDTARTFDNFLVTTPGNPISRFPAVPRVINVELFVNGGWVDVSDDVYARDPITISRGRRDEQSAVAPSLCNLTINNKSGNYSPRNPVGIYYGSLGRNIPIRVFVRLANDTFTRTTSSSWGSADTGQPWTTVGTATNFGVASGVGKLLIPTVSDRPLAYLAGVQLRDVEVAVTGTLSVASVTGDLIFPLEIALRGQDVNNYYLVNVGVDTAGFVTLAISMRYLGVFYDLIVSGTVLTYSPGQALRVRAQVEGQTLRAKLWAASGPEPYAWTLTTNAAYLPLAGWVGVQSEVGTSNTNTKPVTCAYDNLIVRVPRFTGEVSAWPQRWDVTGNDTYVLIEAAGITRRLSHGAAPFRSALYRYYSQLATPPVAYWPGEDLKSATNVASAVAGFSIVPLYRPFSFATYSGIPASAPLFALDKVATGVTGGGGGSGLISAYTSTGSTTLRGVVYIPTGTVDETVNPSGRGSLFFLQCTGTSLAWEVYYSAGGRLGLSQGSLAFDTGGVDFGDIRGRNLLINLQLTESAGNVNYNLLVLEVGQSIGLFIAGTVPSVTVGTSFRLVLDNGDWALGGTIYGHLSVWNAALGITDIAAPLSGFLGETAGSRIQRLCSEENVPFSYRGDLSASLAMGPQGAGASGSGSASLTAISSGQSLLDLLNECGDADTGTLYGSRGDGGVAYRTRADAYNQPAWLNLDYTAGQIAPPLEPVDDDQLTHNNIILTRTNAGSVEAELLTGRMSTLDPSLGGVGQYDIQYTRNVATDAQLPQLATWLLTLGTVDEPRYPTVAINLANLNTAAAGLEQPALAVDIDDRITISNPKTGSTPDQISLLVRGYIEVLNVFTHTISFNCSPETPYEIAQINSNPEYKIDSDTSALVSGVTATATTLSVANVKQPWTTSAGQMPIQIIVAGEQMNITAVSGTSTPQTFTVVRSVNGVVKPQSAGAVVQVIRFIRPIIGL